MSRYYQRSPRRNIFNIFEKGKDFFLIRTIITVIAMIAMLVGCVQLAMRAWEVYPVVIRDSFGNVTMGTGTTYRESPQEIVRIVTTVAESMFTKTETGVAESVLAPYLTTEILNSLKTARSPRDGYISTAYTSDFFFGDINNKAGLRVIFLQLEIVATSFNDIMVDNAYLNFVVRKGPRTTQNPSGWRIVAMQPISRANYFESRRKYVKDELGQVPSVVELLDIESVIE